MDAVIATTGAGRERLERARGRELHPRLLEIPERAGRVDPRELLAALWSDGARLLLSEGGPALHGSLEREALVDELFLTTTAWVPGQDPVSSRRPTFSGVAHSPADTPRTLLVSVKRHGDVLFTRRRYAR
jgi:riboflavin biosynthesis pyrimidine reductase